MVVCTFVLNTNDSSCGKYSWVCITIDHAVSVFSSQKYSVYQSRGRRNSEETCRVDTHSQCGRRWCVFILKETFESSSYLNASIRHFVVMSPRSEALIRLYNTTDNRSKGPLRPAEKQLWSFLSNVFIPKVQDAFSLPEHPKSLSCMCTVYLYMFL